MEDYSDRVVDRLVQFDERSRRFAAVEGIEDAPLRSYQWRCETYNDQGREGACVGFAWSHEIAAKPVAIATDDEWAKKIYHRAKQIDPWDGEDYSGTSVLAGIQAVQEIENRFGNSLVKEYRWAFGIEDTLRVLSHKGPVVLGIAWYESMYRPDSNNFISPTGEIAGGHAILANGLNIVLNDASKTADYSNIDKEKSFVRLHNSWGRGYGDGGDAFITVEDLNTLLEDDGEVCIPSRRAVK